MGNLIKGNIALGGNGSGDYLGKRIHLVTILILEAQVDVLGKDFSLPLFLLFFSSSCGEEWGNSYWVLRGIFGLVAIYFMA